MDLSDNALIVWAAKECGIIKTSAQFWTQFSESRLFYEYVQRNAVITNTQERILQKVSSTNSDEGAICAFDESFPIINSNVNKGDRPYLLFYKGDLSLLRDLNKNVAVVGLIDPTPEIVKRETEVVFRLTEKGLVIVSGLAKGCDAIAHKMCVAKGGKTIAILPTPIHSISPTTNRPLAKEIVANGGLLLSEYDSEPINRMAAISRYIERDRLQAMFAKAVILVASYRKGEGDSGSRHAMEAAKKYGIQRYVMYDESTDMEDKRFGLNKDFVRSNYYGAEILNDTTMENITTRIDPKLAKTPYSVEAKQLTLFDYDE